MVAAYPEEIKQRAKDLRSIGLSMHAIARELGISVQTVSRWVGFIAEESQKKYRLKIKQDPITRQRVLENQRRYVNKNPEKETRRIRERDERRRKDENFKRWRRNWANQKYKNNNEFRVKALLRRRVRLALNGLSKSASTSNLLGCDVKALVEYWDRIYGKEWNNGNHFHVDHIRPCNSFDLTDPRQQFICFNWRNLQVITAAQNIQKGDKWTPEMEENWIIRMRSLGWEGNLFTAFFDA